MVFLDFLPLVALLLALFITGLALYFNFPAKVNRWNTKTKINKKNKWSWIIALALATIAIFLSEFILLPWVKKIFQEKKWNYEWVIGRVVTCLSLFDNTFIISNTHFSN